MIFLTVGTLFPFDRLVSAVDEAVGSGEITEKVFAQISEGAKPPKHIDNLKSVNLHTMKMEHAFPPDMKVPNTHSHIKYRFVQNVHRMRRYFIPKIDTYEKGMISTQNSVVRLK